MKSLNKNTLFTWHLAVLSQNTQCGRHFAYLPPTVSRGIDIIHVLMQRKCNKHGQSGKDIEMTAIYSLY